MKFQDPSTAWFKSYRQHKKVSRMDRHMKKHTSQKQYILCKINLAIVFVRVRFTTSGFYGQIIASRYMRRSLEKEFLEKNQEWSIAAFELAWCQFLRPADVKDIFDHMWEQKIIMKRLFSHLNKENTKNCWKKKKKKWTC